ncbi:MAG: DUF4249 domain-containing protein [Paludibacter sp.]|nr:DUF4249 domain-containing protein [Paludibacter sp.]
MLRIKKNIIIQLITCLIIMSSCTEIIQIDINNSEPQMVVEANIAQGEPATVILTQSVNFYTTDEYPPVQDASVTLTDSEGKTETLTQIRPGVYVSVIMKGAIGKTYDLHIESRDKVITSTCKIPHFVPVDSFRVVNSIYPGGGPPLTPDQSANFYEVYVSYTDPAEKKNYYRIVLWVNGVPSKNNYIYDDRFTNGNQVENLLVVYDPELKKGDSIQVEVQCIEKAVYEYFKSIGNSSMGPGNSSSPSNPYTNLKGAILGYFSAHTVERRQYFIEKQDDINSHSSDIHY